MSFLFGRRKTPEEQLRESKRTIARAVREIDREKRLLEQERVKITNEIKALAKRGQMDACRVMARQLVRTENYIKKFQLMHANLSALSMKVQTLKSTSTMASAMKQVAMTMKRMNTSMKLPQLQKIMMEFEKQSEMMEMKEEIMSDAIDDAIGEEGDLDESEAVVNKVLEELGIEMNTQLNGLPSGQDALAGGATANQGRNRPIAAAEGLPAPPNSTLPGGGGGNSESIDENDLEARLARLKRN